MPINIRPVDDLKVKWENNAGSSAAEYVKGSRNPKRPWAKSAMDAEGNYKTQVIAAANAGRFGRGVTKAGDAGWIGGIERKGEANYQTGVAGSGDMWAEGARPYLTAVSRVDLPPRGAKNSPDNYRRSQMVGDTQFKLKQAMQSASR